MVRAKTKCSFLDNLELLYFYHSDFSTSCSVASWSTELALVADFGTASDNSFLGQKMSVSKPPIKWRAPALFSYVPLGAVLDPCRSPAPAQTSWLLFFSSEFRQTILDRRLKQRLPGRNRHGFLPLRFR